MKQALKKCSVIILTLLATDYLLADTIALVNDNVVHMSSESVTAAQTVIV